MSRSKIMLVIASILVCIGVTLNFLFRSQPAPKEIIPLDQSGFSPIGQTINVVYAGPNINLPNKLPVYKTQTETIEKLADHLIDTLAFETIDETTWINRESQTSMISTRNAIQIGFNVAQVRQAGFTDLDLAINAINSRLNELELNSRMIDPKKYVWVAPQAEVVSVDNAESAGYVEFPLFQKTPEGYPLIYGPLSSQAQRVLVSNAYEVVKITIQPEVIVKEPTQVLDVITLDEAIVQLKSGNNIVLSLNNSESYETASTQDINQLNINTAQLQYRLNPADSLLYPFISFTGTAALKDNTLIDQVEVIVKATK